MAHLDPCICVDLQLPPMDSHRQTDEESLRLNMRTCSKALSESMRSVVSTSTCQAYIISLNIICFTTKLYRCCMCSFKLPSPYTKESNPVELCQGPRGPWQAPSGPPKLQLPSGFRLLHGLCISFGGTCDRCFARSFTHKAPDAAVRLG